jgi:D-amino-acid oxidase
MLIDAWTSPMGVVVDVVVVGAGVSGLSCAVALLEADADVRVLTAGGPAGTVSAVAGAMVGPVFGSGDERSLAWERLSDARFRQLAKVSATGVRIVAGRLLSAPELGPGLPAWAAEVPGFGGELGDDRLPEGFSDGFAVDLPFADMPVYLAWLMRRVRQLGGSVEQQVVTDLDQVGAADCVVNCAGLGAAALAGDGTLMPVWGQHVIVAAPSVTEFAMEGGAARDYISVVPHRRGVLLGGVRRPGRNDLTTDQVIADETVARAAVVMPAVAEAPVLGIEVGMRPGRRDGVRLEAEQVGSTTVVHNYGHDGSGVFWSWGCASDVVALCGLPD